MRRYFLELSYVGTQYHGWQIQANAQSIQAILDAALSKLLKSKIYTLGCGRTDTGVHASQFFAHFESENLNLSDDQEFIYHLNCILPKDIAAKKILHVKPKAHARFDALSRTYQYHITFVKNPFLKDSAMHLRNNPDIAAMNEACAVLVSYSDFSCFSKSLTQVKTNICKIMFAQWEPVKDGLVFTITADRFLRNMVRAIVGTMLEIGKGRMTIDELRTIIEGKDRKEAGASAPACGLFLTCVNYPPDIFEL